MNIQSCKYLIIFLFFFALGCENKKNEESSKSDTNSELENKTEQIPTAEKVEYVFACMQGNEDSQAYISKCSCSIDYIDEQMTYEQYVEAETIMSLRQIYGEKRGTVEISSSKLKAITIPAKISPLIIVRFS